jgi:hypothetical protein
VRLQPNSAITNLIFAVLDDHTKLQGVKAGDLKVIDNLLTLFYFTLHSMASLACAFFFSSINFCVLCCDQVYEPGTKFDERGVPNGGRKPVDPGLPIADQAKGQVPGQSETYIIVVAPKPEPAHSVLQGQKTSGSHH